MLPDFDDNVDADVKDEEDEDEMLRFQVLIDKLTKALPYDVQLIKSVFSTRWDIDWEALEASGKDICPDSGVDAVGSVPDDTEVIRLGRKS